MIDEKTIAELRELLAAYESGRMRNPATREAARMNGWAALPGLLNEIEQREKRICAEIAYNTRFRERITKLEAENELQRSEIGMLRKCHKVTLDDYEKLSERITELESKLSNIASGRLNYADCLDLAHDAINNKRGN